MFIHIYKNSDNVYAVVNNYIFHKNTNDLIYLVEQREQ